MSVAVHYKKRWLPAKRVKLSLTTIENLDSFLLATIASLFTRIEQIALAQISKQWHKAIILQHAQELGYKGKDPLKAQLRVNNLLLRVLIFQEGKDQTPFTMPFRWDPQLKKKIYPHPLSLLFGRCKQMQLDEICTSFLLNPHHYMAEETPWIDFFEVESSWSQVSFSNTPQDNQMLAQALTYACYFYRPVLIHILLQRGAPPSGDAIPHPINQNENLPKPLDALIPTRDQKLIALLIEKGAPVETHHLIAAIGRGDPQNTNLPLFKFLLPHCPKPLLSFTLLDEAIYVESSEAIELIFEAGCSIDPRQALTLIYLFMTSRFFKKGSCEDPFATFLLKRLQEKGADLNGMCPSNHTLLHEAALEGSLPWAEWLLKNGAHVESKTPHQGYTPLYYACDYLQNSSAPTPEELNLIRLLLLYGAQPICEDREKSPYFLAKRNGSKEIVALFDGHTKTQ